MTTKFGFKILPCSATFKEPQDGVLFASEYCTLKANAFASIPLGFKTWFPSSFLALVHAGPGDPQFRVIPAAIRGDCQREWNVVVRSTSDKTLYIERGAPIAAFSLIPRFTVVQEIVDDLPAPAGSTIPHPKGL